MANIDINLGMDTSGKVCTVANWCIDRFTQVLIIPILEKDYNKNQNNREITPEIKEIFKGLADYFWKMRYALSNSLIYLARRNLNYDNKDYSVSFDVFSDTSPIEVFYDYFHPFDDFYIIISDTILCDDEECFGLDILVDYISNTELMSISKYDKYHYQSYES